MSDEIERRLYEDAGRQPAIEPPALDEAVRAASRPSRHVLTSLSAAATVALIGGLGVAVATHDSGHHSAAGSPLAGHYSVDGLLADQRGAARVTVYFSVGSCVHQHGFAVRLISESRQALHLGIVTAARSRGAVTARPANQTRVVGIAGIDEPTGVPTGPTAGATGPTGGPTGPTGNPTGPTGGPTGPTGNPTGPTGNPTGPTGNPTGPTGGVPSSSASASGGNRPQNQTGVPTGAPSGSGVAKACAPTRGYAATVRLARPAGQRPVYVDGAQQVVIDPRFAARVPAPRGYHLVSNQRYDNGLQHVVIWVDRAGHPLALDYGPPDNAPPAGRVVSRPEVHGQPATLIEAPGVRELRWTLPSGGVVELTSTGDSPADNAAPVTGAELLAIARSLH